MDPHTLITRLDEQRETVVAAFRAVPDAEVRWHPGEGRWSLIEVLGHLLDEEQDDFRPRIHATLERAEWVPIDPEARVRERAHQSADPAERLQRFDAKRRASVEWLRSLQVADWSQRHAHPQLGPISAGDLLASWVAHDLLHL